MDSASLELTYRLMTLSEGRTISARCMGAHMVPCVEGIGHGQCHIRLMQFHEAFARLEGLDVGAVWLATAHGTCQNGVAKVRLPSAGCPSRNRVTARACKCRDEETTMVRVRTLARPALIKRNRVSISRAFRKASAGLNRCTDERERRRRGTCDRARESDAAV